MTDEELRAAIERTLQDIPAASPADQPFLAAALEDMRAELAGRAAMP